MIQVELEGIAVSGDENQFLVLLRSADGALLPIEVDASQALSIAAGRSSERQDRPYTHDLMHSVIELLGASVKRVEITDLLSGVFYATLILDRAGVSFELDARPSDALAIAVRTHAPILVAQNVLEDASMRDDDFESAGGAEA